jgi:hypothetical protein
VVGSALVQRIADLAEDPPAAIQSVAVLLSEMRAALDGSGEAAGQRIGAKRKTTDHGVV